jgi:hypothetical protein
LIANGVHLLARWRNEIDVLSQSDRQDVELRCQVDLIGSSRICAALALVAEALVTVQWATLKGPVLDEHLYPRPGLRPYSDLDVLVRPTEVQAALGALEGAGAVLIDRNLPLAQAQRRGELGVRLPGGTVLDLHWHLVNDPRARVSFALPSADVALARSIDVRLVGVSTQRLDAADTVVHLAVHAMTSGADRAIWAHDLRYALADPQLDLGELAARAGRAAPVIDLMLARAARTASFAPPPRLAPRATLWTTAMGVVSARHPMGRSGTGHTGRSLFAATRPTTVESVDALLRARVHERRGGPAKSDLAVRRDSIAQRREFFEWIVADSGSARG